MQTAYLLMGCFGILAALVETAEYLSQSALFQPSGIYSWKILRTRSRQNLRLTQGIREWFFNEGGVRLLLFARLTALILFGVSLALHHEISRSDLVPLTSVLGTSMLLAYRTEFGRDGADQMTIFVFTGLLVTDLFSTRYHQSSLGMWFVTLQACLSYVAAGLSKLLSPVWRTGKAAAMIFNTYTYG